MVWTVEALIHSLPSHPTSNRIQTSTVDLWTQTRALISSPTPSYLWGLRLPLCLPPSLLPAAPAGLPHSPHQLQPFHVAWAPGSMTPGVSESGRSEIILPTANPGISQKFPALRLKPCGHVGQLPHNPQAARGDRDIPQILANNGMSQSVLSGKLIAFHKC